MSYIHLGNLSHFNLFLFKLSLRLFLFFNPCIYTFSFSVSSEKTAREKAKDLSVNVVGRTVDASYEVDDINILVRFEIPSLYPLQPIEVSRHRSISK